MQRAKPEQRFLSIRIPISLYEQIEAVAETEDRTLSQEVRRAIARHVEAHQPREPEEVAA